MGFFDAAADVLGHRLELRERAYGATRLYWIDCSCGYESKPGRSRKFALNAGIGHVQRVGERVSRGVESGQYDTPGVSLPRSAAGSA